MRHHESPEDIVAALVGARIRMTPDTRLLLYAFLAVVALIVLIARFKLHPFIALVLSRSRWASRRGCRSARR